MNMRSVVPQLCKDQRLTSVKIFIHTRSDLPTWHIASTHVLNISDVFSRVSFWARLFNPSCNRLNGSRLCTHICLCVSCRYLPSKAHHMLPKSLSQTVCSLTPGKPKMAFTCRFYLNPDGTIFTSRDPEIFKSVSYMWCTLRWEMHASKHEGYMLKRIACRSRQWSSSTRSSLCLAYARDDHPMAWWSFRRIYM